MKPSAACGIWPFAVVAAVALCGCSKADPANDASAADVGDAGTDVGADLVAADVAADLGRPADATYELLRTQPDTQRLGEVRGREIVRGIIHAHSIHSHDACDGEPELPDGTPNEPCLRDFRNAVCETRQDFVFLSDHEELFAFKDFELLSLWREGDNRITRDDRTIANQVVCENGHTAFLIPGGEFGLMPIGLEDHLPGTADERNAAYSEASAARADSFRDLGAVVLQAHAESRDREELRALGLDGFEVYQLHANVDPSIREDFLGLDPAGFLNAAVPFVQGAGGHPDLLFLTFFAPNTPAVAHFDALVADGQHLTGTGGTDCHQNVLRMQMTDGERVDGYRRMMRWFSNHLLVDDYTVDGLRDAVRDGRLAIVFEVLGTPSGADFVAEARGRFYDMGDTVSLSVGPTLRVERPDVLDWGRAPVRIELLKSNPDGTATVVATGASTVEHAVTEPGAYRAVVYITPEHLADHFDDERRELATREYEWIWFNPIYVEP